jgi:hypothetical protein
MACKIGQIVARGDGRWLIRIYLGRDHETKKRRGHNRTIHSPMREAQAPYSGPNRFKDATVISRRRRGGGCGFSFRNSAISHTYQEKRSNLNLSSS